jgi:hypothetical protein
VSDYIEIDEGIEYYITASADYGNALFAWYDSTKTFISAYTKNNSGSTVKKVEDEPFTAPTNAKYIRLSFITPEVSSIYDYKYTLDIEQRVETLEDLTLTTNYTHIQYTTENKKLLNHEGVIVNVPNLAQYNISDYIDVVEGVRYYITASADYGNSFLVWYDSNKNILSYYTGSNTGSTVKKIINEPFTAPENAKYIMLSFITPNTSDIAYEDGVKNILKDRVESLENKMTSAEKSINVFSNAFGIGNDDVELTKSGDNITIKDIASGMYITANLKGSNNGAFNLTEYRNLSGTLYKTAGDDICPIMYDGAYRCGITETR